MTPATDIVQIWKQLGEDEKRTLLYLVDRLLMGQERYGVINIKADTRDFAKERREEIADLLVYTAFQALK